MIKQTLTDILLIEDDEGHAKLLRKAFRGKEDNFNIQVVTSLKAAREYLSENTPGIILTDLVLPDGRGMDLLLPRAEDLPFPVVVMTSFGDETTAVEAIKLGALDYVVKSSDTLEAMPRIILRALREWAHILKRRQAEEQLKKLNDQLIEANKKLERLANFDSLTGVANRRNFLEIYTKEWKRGCRSKQPLSLVMIDVDFFKLYNDFYGHQAGDECLKEIALLLNEALPRAGDVLARYGGEEFIAILPGTDMNGTCAVAEKLRKKIESAAIHHKSSSISNYVTISLGVASMIPSARKTKESLIGAADEALYKAKRKGRNRVECP
ncbi:MAG: diguanylate cyclase [Acidobacteria bacterium]|jgi:diguanylate cyclase (GGDEF)-like protein|nr:diguanylate cyclase [Acidobacteriota bacterium]